jgi:hypothetical protein
MNRSILIPESVSEKLVKRLARLAAKAGVDLTIAEGRTVQYRKVAKFVGHSAPNQWGERARLFRHVVDPKIVIECVRVTVGELPRCNGFEFLGKIQHEEAGNILALAPQAQGTELPVEWRDAKPICDHCGTKRRRNDTFIIRTPEGRIVRVGRNCLADFLATDPTAWIALSAFQDELYSVETSDWSEGDFCGGGSIKHYPSVEWFLACAVASVAQNGYWKRGGCPEGRCPTVSDAEFLAQPYVGNNPKTARDWTERQPTAEHEATAVSVALWLGETDDKSDYIHNLKVAASGRCASSRVTGLLASAVVAYDRAIGVLVAKKQRAELADAGFTGTVKERLRNIEVTITHVGSFFCESEHYIGTKFVVGFRDDASHNYVTFTTGDGPRAGDVGKRFKVTGTVKAHKMREEKHQTVLNRCLWTEL